jgi:hypothetical protein
MAKYFPIDASVSFRADHSDLLKIDWSVDHLRADFIVPDDNDHALRVSFDGGTIVRLLDEMPLSTEDGPSKNEGLVPFHFAYRVEGATFAQTQSAAWREIRGPVVHYEFVTGSACMDVLAPVTPTFELVVLDKDAVAERERRWKGDPTRV